MQCQFDSANLDPWKVLKTFHDAFYTTYIISLSLCLTWIQSVNHRKGRRNFFSCYFVQVRRYWLLSTMTQKPRRMSLLVALRRAPTRGTSLTRLVPIRSKPSSIWPSIVSSTSSTNAVKPSCSTPLVSKCPVCTFFGLKWKADVKLHALSVKVPGGLPYQNCQNSSITKGTGFDGFGVDQFFFGDYLVPNWQNLRLFHYK